MARIHISHQIFCLKVLLLWIFMVDETNICISKFFKENKWKTNPLYGFGEYAGKQVRDQKKLFMVCESVPVYVKDLTHAIGQSPEVPSAAKQHTGPKTRRGRVSSLSLSLSDDCCLVRLFLNTLLHLCVCDIHTNYRHANFTEVVDVSLK